jgi:tripartite-type tricarboxylate transporter receptor subunit TctC
MLGKEGNEMVERIGKILLCFIAFWCVSFFMPDANSAWAKYPERPIRLIVTAAPGGASDLVGRALVRFATPFLQGAQVFVENVSGGGNAIGLRKAAASTADGYTIVLLNTAIASGPPTTNDFPTYDLFSPICIAATETRFVVAPWESKFKTIGDAISAAKANPGKLTVGTDGTGTTSHMGIMALSAATGAKFTLVPYRGTGPAVIAAMSGELDLVVSSSSGLKTNYDSKKLRPLVSFGGKRHDIYPGNPTAKELGYDVEVYSFNGIAAPKNTPKEVTEFLAPAFRKATEDPEYRKIITSMGLDCIFIGPEEAIPWVKNQVNFYGGLARKIGIKPQ